MAGKLPRVIVKPGREKSLLQRHPWLFSGAVDRVEGEPEPGGVAEVFSASGDYLATAGWSPHSQLRCRVWSFRRDERIDREFFRRRLKKCAALRRELHLDDPSGGCRLVYSEGDGLPGLIVDRFGAYGVVQFLSYPAEYFREIIVPELLDVFGLAGLYERSDAGVRGKEGLSAVSCQLAGAEVPRQVVIVEDGLRFQADLHCGQKTGFYFDLRKVRKTVGQLAAGRRVLNAFSFTGGFACAALRGGAASVINLDSSRPALQQATENLRLNGFAAGQWENQVCDTFTELKARREAGEQFDLVILDPPKLIESRDALTRGCRAYQFLARQGFGLLREGGILLNMSCSGLMPPELLQKITHDAALEAGCAAQLIGTVRQAADHPVALNVPETAYLKGFISLVASKA